MFAKREYHFERPRRTVLDGLSAAGFWVAAAAFGVLAYLEYRAYELLPAAAFSLATIAAATAAVAPKRT